MTGFPMEGERAISQGLIGVVSEPLARGSHVLVIAAHYQFHLV